ncbi:MAG: hypothetical protein M5U14_07930 [Acidimicrobiia bacterium]|nr:hypothetical protein [Acidimicrobiia bacterium]
MTPAPGGIPPSSKFHSQVMPPAGRVLGPYPFQSFQGPRDPMSWLLTMTTPGFSRCTVSQSRPMSAIVPVEPFSMITSAQATSRRARASPSSVFTFTPKLRFTRLDEAKDALISLPATVRMKSG